MRLRSAVGLTVLFLVSSLPAASATTLEPGKILWHRTYDGPGQYDNPNDVVVSGDGTTVFVTGYGGGAHPLQTVAYDAATGQTKWISSLLGSSAYPDAIHATVVDPTGTLVVATRALMDSHAKIITVGLSVTTGRPLWKTIHHSPGEYVEAVVSIDSTAYVVGRTYLDGESQYLVLAYDAATGDLAWKRTITGHFPTYADAVPSPDGSRLYLAAAQGCGYEECSTLTWRILALDPRTGETLWDRLPRWGDGSLPSIAAAGSGLYVAAPHTWADGTDVAAFDGVTGRLRWRTVIANLHPAYITVTPDERRVVVSGRHDEYRYPVLVTAYDAHTGQTLWQHDLPNRGYHIPCDLAARPDSSAVYIGGAVRKPSGAWRWRVLSLAASDGHTRWERRAYPIYNLVSYECNHLAVSPDGLRVFMSGRVRVRGGTDYGTAAFAA